MVYGFCVQPGSHVAVQSVCVGVSVCVHAWACTCVFHSPSIICHHLCHTSIGSHQTIDVNGFLKLICQTMLHHNRNTKHHNSKVYCTNQNPQLISPLVVGITVVSVWNLHNVKRI